MPNSYNFHTTTFQKNVMFSPSSTFIAGCVIACAALLSACSTPSSEYKGEDKATLMLTTLGHPELPPVLVMRRMSDKAEFEIAYSNGFDKAVSQIAPDRDIFRIGLVRQLQPGKYEVIGIGLGRDQDGRRMRAVLPASVSFTLKPREKLYLGSYHVAVGLIPDPAAEKDLKDGTTMHVSYFGLSAAVADNVDVDLPTLALADPTLDVRNVTNATPAAAETPAGLSGQVLDAPNDHPLPPRRRSLM